MQLTDKEIALIIFNLRSKSYLSKDNKFILSSLAYDFVDAFRQIEPGYDDKAFFNCVEKGVEK